MFFVGVAPLVALGFLTFYSLSVFHRFDVAAIEDNLIGEKIKVIDGFVNGIVEILQLKVGLPDVQIASSSERFFLLGLLKENPSLEEAAFINLEGMETSRFGRFYPNGVPQDELQNQKFVEKFIAAKNGQNYIGPIYFTLKGPMLSVAAPVRNRDGKIIAVLAGEAGLSVLQKTIKNTSLGNSGYVYLVDQDGFLVAHSFSGAAEFSSFSNFGFIADLVKGNNYLGVEGQRRYKSFLGEEVVAAGSYLERYHLAVVAEWPVQDADLLINAVKNQSVAAIILVLLAVFVLSALLADQIVKPIKILEASAQLVAQGRFDKPVNIKTNDEIEELGTAFNAMMIGLKRFEELKEEFVFIAAHELKTPVAAIKGYLSLILEGLAGPVSEQVKSFLGNVIKANQRLIQLVEDLLSVARSESGRLTIPLAVIDIKEPIAAVLKELKSLADEKKIGIFYNPPLNLPQAMGNSDRVKEIMVNLIGNAVKYTPYSGKIEIFHSIRENFLVTEIKDSGLGIAPEFQKKLFEKFYRVPDERIKGISGTGLGLFIVKQIIEKMNGRIWFISEKDKGSTFSFSLPLA